MDEYKKFGVSLAEIAGEIMLDHFTFNKEKMWKTDNTPVTVADIEINKMVVDKVNKRYPGHAVLGEEQSDLHESEFTWVCDPIDGTVPFSSGIPISTFSLALAQDGKPIVSVLYDPFMKRMYSAIKGQGAYLNDIKLYVNEEEDLTKSVIAMEGRNIAPYLIYDMRTKLHMKGVRVMTLVSFAYSTALVATGSLIATIFANKNPWDVAAVKLLVDEAGGKTTDFEGNEQRYDHDINGFVASNGIIHEELLEYIAKFAVKNKEIT